MTEIECQNALKALLRQVALMTEKEAAKAEVPDDLVNLRYVRTFQEEGVLTNNAGLTLITADSSEFEITIVQSR